MTYINSLNIKKLNVKALDVLADKTRRAILERIARSPCTVGQITDAMQVSQPAVSQHLKVLKEAGLVKAEKAGVKRIYSIAPDGIKEVRQYFDCLWSDALNAFKATADNQLEGENHESE